MEIFTQILSELGAAGLELFWLPVGIWTLIALAVAAFLHIFEHKISAVYQYHGRVALLWGLAAGVAGSALLYFFPLGSTGGAGLNAKFIVIQNPVTIAAAAPEAAINWSAPALWAGIITVLTIITAFVGLLKLGLDFSRLNLFSKNLSQSDQEVKAKLSQANHRLLNRSRASLSFSDEVAVPCTFGWARKHIVLPQEFSNEPEKMNMALLHELTHIANSDYLINSSVQAVKALFFFHPLVHRLAGRIEEYREITCDQQVLQDTAISHKSYAQLLFDLSPKTVFKPQPAAVSMAVHPSTLKKRIQTMMTSNKNLPSIKWSLSLMLTFTLLLGGLMACSDIEEGGITSTEVEQTQSEMSKASEGNEPLYVLNGEQMDSPENKDIMARLKPKYIESLDVLKGEKATNTYGEKGKNGVIKIKLIDRKAALSDLRTEQEMMDMKANLNKSSNSKEEIFVAVEKQPEIIGGQKALFNELEYPEECKNAGIEGRVITQFVVTKQGNLRDAEVVRGIGGGCDQAAINAVSAMKFKPGEQGGEAVNTRFSLPIVFQLAKDDTSGQK
jgi:TonB family protein